MLFHPPALTCILRHLHPRYEFAFREIFEGNEKGEKGKSTFGGMFEGVMTTRLSDGVLLVIGGMSGRMLSDPWAVDLFCLAGRWNGNTVLRIDLWLEEFVWVFMENLWVGWRNFEDWNVKTSTVFEELKQKLGMFVSILKLKSFDQLTSTNSLETPLRHSS
jgi:hypothetical protein